MLAAVPVTDTVPEPLLLTVTLVVPTVNVPFATDSVVVNLFEGFISPQ